MIRVELDPDKNSAAIESAWKTMRVSGARGLDHAIRYQRPIEVRLAHEVRNYCAREAVSIWLNKPWDRRLHTFHRYPDFEDGGPGIDVRSIGESDHRLIIRPDDIFSRRFILVQGLPPTRVTSSDPVVMRILGWIRGGDALRNEWWHDANGLNEPAWWVPQSALWELP